MARLMRDFKCDSCGASYERFIDTQVHYIPCECGQKAHRIVGMPRVALDGTDPGFPDAYDRWATIREKNAQQKARRDA
jgi:hypothetical protein